MVYSQAPNEKPLKDILSRFKLDIVRFIQGIRLIMVEM